VEDFGWTFSEGSSPLPRIGAEEPLGNQDLFVADVKHRARVGKNKHRTFMRDARLK